MALALRFAARSDVGLIRDGNEDSAYAGPRLLVVADGMGGHAAGEVASSVAVATLSALDEDSPGPDLLGRLEAAVEEANAHLRDMVAGDPALRGMGTTLTALLRAGSRFGLVHVGDSRAYLLRDSLLQQVTHDDTFVQQLVDEGRITPEEAGHHPQRALITNALDGRGDVDPDLSVREARAGDRWLLCSDGLSGVVSADTLEETLARHASPDDAADALVQLALRGGAPDNVTCIVADVVDVDSAPPDIPQVVGAAASGPVKHLRDDDRARTSPAARAAALAARPRPDEGEDGGGDGAAHDEAPRRRWPRRLLTLGVVAVLLAAAGTALWGWSRDQYYVGAHEDEVAVFQGLQQSVLGVGLSTVYEEEPIPLAALSDYSRRQVEGGIAADGLDDAREVVARLQEEAARCEQEPAPAAPTPRATPGRTPAPGASPRATPGATPGAAPGAAPAATPGAAPRATPEATPGPSPRAPGAGERACPEPAR
ncbi:PP2C family protein-serine/threonine phosphatase [Vallicoccus soli]|uniref:Serine/threonine protein phosphatase PstP n=1 Tax=Vallicoccus soli TaxID=2339232 RepID=A0A3A3YTG1_9ACTN|nr:PP2C family serine/threonine-protein phosphatase [Vallicoccus soli]RJK94725.1 serine/threonine-protein phosphatase [Vallicoccus soli]